MHRFASKFTALVHSSWEDLLPAYARLLKCPRTILKANSTPSTESSQPHPLANKWSSTDITLNIPNIEVTAFALLQPQLDFFDLPVTAYGERVARLNGVEDADQSLRDAVASGDFARLLLFADLAGGNINHGTTELFGQSFGAGFDRFGGFLNQLAEVLE